jgi:hypothetical protein
MLEAQLLQAGCLAEVDINACKGRVVNMEVNEAYIVVRL